MADYLSRLVDRTLGHFSTVRPDIPPAFATETAEIAPFDAPHGRPPQIPEPSERAEEATPRDENKWPDTGERGYDILPSTAAGTPDRPGAPLTRGAESFSTRSTEIEHPSPGPGWADDEPPQGPEHQWRSSPTPSDAAVPGATEDPSAEGPSIFPNLHEAPPSTPPPRLDERPTGSSESRIGRAGHPSAPSGSDTHPAEHPGTEQGEFDVSQSRRRTRSSNVRTHVAPPPDRAGSRAARQGGRDLAVGREEHERTPEPAADARGRPLAEPPSSGRAESLSGSARRPVPDTPLVPFSDRPRATTAAELVGAPHKREGTQEASSPTVRITIGRVEVRAATPEPAQPLPAARPEPALSLEDYLKQHDGGRR